MIKSGKDIIFAARLIKEGKLVAFPTETVYGLGADGLNAKAVARIFEVKKRPSFDPLILHIDKIDVLGDIFKNPVSPLILRLAEKYWPGPLTIVAPRHKNIPDIVTSGLSTVAVRMPNHPVALKLIRHSGVPIAAPSANLFGRISPTTPEHVKMQLDKVDYLINGGKTNFGIESTIVSVTDKTIEILRPGVITDIQLAADFPDVKIVHGDSSEKISSPGQLKKHYSPSKPFFLVEELPEELPNNVALVLIEPIKLPKSAKCKFYYLSPKGDLLEAASNLFAAFHDFEKARIVEKIYTIKIKEEGIGKAIMDRLKKAAFQYEEK